jgi:hypothetical protein
MVLPSVIMVMNCQFATLYNFEDLKVMLFFLYH